MVGVRCSLSSLCSLLIRGAVLALLAVVAVIAAGPRAHGADSFTFNGVTCMDVHLDDTPTTTKGNPPGTEDDRAVIILSRIEPNPTLANTFLVTSVSYTGPGELIPTKPPTTTPCSSQGDGNSLNSSIAVGPLNLSARPTATATIVMKGAQRNLAWERCQFEEDLLGGMSVLSKFELVVGKTLTTFNYGILTAYLDDRGSVATPFCTTSPNFTTYRTVLVSSIRDKNTGVPSPSLRDDWDGDGVTDWNELGNPPPFTSAGDPFVPDSVGGIAELPDVTDAARAAGRSSETNTGLIAGIASAIAAGVAAVGGAAWYVRRRRVP